MIPRGTGSLEGPRAAGPVWDEDAPEPTPSSRPEKGPGRPRRGRFLTFEGIEGSGKTTQITRIAERLHAAGEDLLVTREPGGTALGRRLRAVLLEVDANPIAPFAELMLYVADRAQHLAETIEPALAAGRAVLCDRYVDATLAYQGYGRGLSLDGIRTLHSAPPLDRRPDRTILLDLDPRIGVERARHRNRELDIEHAEGRFEREHLEFHRRVRDGYLALAAAEPFRFRIVAAEEDPRDVEARIADLLADLFPALDTDEP